MSAAGSIFGLAYGDATGAHTEFMDLKKILKATRGRPQLLGVPRDGLVTDDTQMGMYVGEALLQTMANAGAGEIDYGLSLIHI